MSAKQYPLCKKLQNIEDMKEKDVQTRLKLVKKVLEEELESRGINEFSKARFEVAYSIDDKEFNVALSRMELKAKLNLILQKYTKTEPVFSTDPDLILIHLEYHKSLLGDSFFEVVKETFQENYDDVIKAMSEDLVAHIKTRMSRYYSGSSPEAHKTETQIYFNEKYKGTLFENMVISLTNNYVENGECLRM